MDSENTPNSFSQEVTTKDGTVKLVIAQSQAELDEAVKAVKGDALPVGPDILNPDDGNKIVSPDNLAVEPPYVQPVDPEVPEEVPAKTTRKSSSSTSSTTPSSP